MKNWKQNLIVCFMAIIVLTFVACKEDDQQKIFIVTFDSDGGTSVISQTVNENSYINEPTIPIKYSPSGLYLDIPPLTCTFIEWQKPDGTKWDFVADIVTANITLKAKWNSPIPIDLIEIENSSILEQAMSYIKDNNSNDEKYTLLLNNDIECFGSIGYQITYDLTIIGTGSVRTIKAADIYSSLYIYVSENSSLTIGNNINLSGEMNYNGFVIPAGDVITVSTSGGTGNLIMLNGSKIIGSVSTGHFATFNMKGGTITGEIRIYEGDLILSGNTEVNSITLWNRNNANTRKIFISPDWSGNVEVFNIGGTAPLDEVKGSGNYGGFSGNSVIHADIGYTITQADVVRFPLGNFIGWQNIQEQWQNVYEPINETHNLELDTISNTIKLIAK